MARWYLTSSMTAHLAAQAACERAELRSSGKIEGAGFFLQSYFKRTTPVQNLWSGDDGDWVCSAGTLLCKADPGVESLRNCYAAFVSGGMHAVQVSALGHFALAVKRGAEITIFTDPNGSHTLYYLQDHAFWFASNSLHLCASVMSERRIDQTLLLINALQTSAPGEDTFYCGIKRLFGVQELKVSLPGGSCSLLCRQTSPSSEEWNLPTIQLAVERYVEEVQQVFRVLKRMGRIGVLCTGGLDSRTVLAGLLNQCADLELFYGWGNSKMTDYHSVDRDISRLIAEKNGLAFYQMDWSGTQPYDEATLESLFHTYGFRYEVFGASNAFIKSFSDRPESLPNLFVGGYCPAFTNAKPWELTEPSFMFDRLLDDCLKFHKGAIAESHAIRGKRHYRELYASQVRSAFAIAGVEYPESGASLEVYVRAKLLLYIRAESRFLNLLNEFCPYIAPFLLKQLYDPLLSVPMRFRTHDEFQIRLIDALAPRLLDLPLYSGWGEARIDRGTFRLIREEEKRRPPTVLHRIAHMAPGAITNPLRGAVRRTRLAFHQGGTPEALRDARIRDAYSRQVMSDSLGRAWFTSTEELSVKELSRIRHYMAGVRTLGYLS